MIQIRLVITSISLSHLSILCISIRIYASLIDTILPKLNYFRLMWSDFDFDSLRFLKDVDRFRPCNWLPKLTGFGFGGRYFASGTAVLIFRSRLFIIWLIRSKCSSRVLSSSFSIFWDSVFSSVCFVLILKFRNDFKFALWNLIKILIRC